MVTITMLATLCHLAGAPAVEFCEERRVAQRVEDIDPREKAEVKEAVAACYRAAQVEIAARIMPGFTVKDIRCTDGHDDRDKPRNSI